MAWTQADLDAIDEAIASNVFRVRTADGRLLEYRSVRELKEARAMVEKAVASPTTPLIRKPRMDAGWEA